MITKGRAILGTVNLKSRLRTAYGSPLSPTLFLPNIKRKASNSWSAVQDTYCSTKDILYVKFIKQILRKGFESLEDTMKKKYDLEHEEIKKIVTTSSVSTTACIATAGTSMVVGYFLGWRGGAWFARRKLRREQLKLLGQLKPNKWQILRRPFVRLRMRTAKKSTEHQSNIEISKKIQHKVVRSLQEPSTSTA